jgi:hypothetical protein
MTASFNLTLDTQAPSNPALLINGGAALTGERVVWLRLTTADHLTGSNDVADMKVWGDLDPTADPAFQVAEGDAQWLPYTEQVAVMLSLGTGRKHLYARLRDDVGNPTLPFTDFIDYDPSIPVVTISTAADRGRISRVAPFDAATFVWESSVPFTAYQIRVVPTHGSPQQAGVVIPHAGGSINVQGNGEFPADTPIITTIRGDDLQAASPGDTTKIVKVFIQAGGVWSA